MAVIGSNNEQGAYPTMVFQESQTWACPVAMEAIVYVIGAGGGGATIGGNSESSYNGRGGGAGGCAVSRLSLSAQNYTVTIGSGGASYGSGGGAYTGNAGGNSVFSGTGIDTMTGNGGAGGTASTSAQDITSGGGTATGGNLMNNTGGGGGANTSSSGKISGGGGVNLYGSSCNGHGEESTYAAGGSPTGISGGDYARTFYSPGGNSYSQNQTLSVSYFPSLMVHQSGFDLAYDVDNANVKLTRHESTVYSNTRQYVTITSNSQDKGVYAQAGPFCGGAGYRASCSGSEINSMAGGVGAGGGAATNQSSGRSAYSGAGGSGLIIIFPIQLG